MGVKVEHSFIKLGNHIFLVLIFDRCGYHSDLDFVSAFGEVTAQFNITIKIGNEILLYREKTEACFSIDKVVRIKLGNKEKVDQMNSKINNVNANVHMDIEIEINSNQLIKYINGDSNIDIDDDKSLNNKVIYLESDYDCDYDYYHNYYDRIYKQKDDCLCITKIVNVPVITIDEPMNWAECYNSLEN